MKRIMLFMMLMLGTVSAVMAQGADVPATDYDAMIGTFAGFVGGVVVLTEGCLLYTSPSPRDCS